MPRNNPFRPTFGASPKVWAGRTTVLDEFTTALESGPGHPNRSLIISGSRGIGKTVLLTELEDKARATGWVVIRASGREGMAETLTNSTIPELIESLEPAPKRKFTGFNVAGLGGVRSELVDEQPVAPRLVTRLHQLLTLLKGTGVLFTIDEIQDSNPADLTEIAVAYQDLVRDDAEVALAMAGLTQGVNNLLNLPGATFLRRARHYELGPLTIDDATATLRDTAQEAGKPFLNDAARRAGELTQGYPYLVQLIGYLAWNHAVGDAITGRDVSSISEEAIEILGKQVHQPSLRAVPPRQREYLDAMAHIQSQTGRAQVSTADLTTALDRPTTALSDTRGKLIDRDLIVPAGWGEVEFAQPYLGDYLRREQRPTRVN
ncbi:ATP-binding protein [Corynebacterium breve]|uniref:ATP-binding protein n=1 Tax=Corynebacterium breve TaxID=3049799 RepID=A0ABY8VCL7_9CORY|nr:ATP-binding protein [Corynebacterium breve]WIM66847.1 ATP-binding protein [Corynebacterium breve]